MTLTAAVPHWLTTTTAISDPTWEWIVFLLCRAGKRCWCSISTRAVAAALGRKEDTGTRLTREAIATGLVARLCRHDATLWIINIEALLSGKLSPGWQPAQELQAAVIADYANRKAYADRAKELSVDSSLADHRLVSFSSVNYGGEADLLSLARRRSQASHAFTLAVIENERFQKAHHTTGSSVGDRMLADPAFAADWRRHDGLQLQRQHQRELVEAEWNELYAQAREATARVRNRIREHQKVTPASPEALLRKPLARGTYSLTPRGLMTKEFQKEHRLRDASGVRRLMTVLLGMAKGACTYDTTIKAIAQRLGRHRETVGVGLQVLHDAGMIGLGYITAKTKELAYAPSDTGTKVAWGISSSRIRGVRVTLTGNRAKGRAKSELPPEYLDLVVYDQPRRVHTEKSASLKKEGSVV